MPTGSKKASDMKLLEPGTEIDGFRVVDCIHAGLGVEALNLAVFDVAEAIGGVARARQERASGICHHFTGRTKRRDVRICQRRALHLAQIGADPWNRAALFGPIDERLIDITPAPTLGVGSAEYARFVSNPSDVAARSAEPAVKPGWADLWRRRRDQNRPTSTIGCRSQNSAARTVAYLRRGRISPRSLLRDAAIALYAEPGDGSFHHIAVLEEDAEGRTVAVRRSGADHITGHELYPVGEIGDLALDRRHHVGGALVLIDLAVHRQANGEVIGIGDAFARHDRRAEGEEVDVPQGEVCCGSLVHHMGREEQALAQARINVDVWTSACSS
eukprot:gene33502-44860_t